MSTTIAESDLRATAQAALLKAQISYQGVSAQGHAFEVKHGTETAFVIFDAQTQALRCNCPHFANGETPCLHIELLRLWRAAQKSSSANPGNAQPSDRPKPPPPPGKMNGQLSQDAPMAPAKAAPPASATLGEQMVLPWGKFKGQSLSQLAATAEGQTYLFFLARKREARGEADQALNAAAEQVLVTTVAQLVQAAQETPERAMPVLPFGEEKGKPLHQAHPKWAAILAKKSDADARSFQDLVLYRVAQALQAARGPNSGRRHSGLSDEQFEQLLAELRGIRTALEKALVTPA